jgi:hydrogenase/urease accessory protein HupE
MIARACLGLALAVLAAQPAMAHPPPLGIGGFAGGLLHPLFVPAHALAVLALGLLIGQQVAWTRIAALSFIVGLAGGLGVMTLGVVPSLMNEVVLACALIAGFLGALARPVVEAVGCAFAVLIGFCIALDSPPEAISLTEANLMLVGTGLGAALLLIVTSELARRLQSAWPRILGSWIAASAILVLALRLAR